MPTSASRPTFLLPLPTLPLSDRDDADPMDRSRDALQGRPVDQLREARCHHRRALRALQGEAYRAIDADTRARLVERLQADLSALNAAIRRGA